MLDEVRSFALVLGVTGRLLWVSYLFFLTMGLFYTAVVLPWRRTSTTNKGWGLVSPTAAKSLALAGWNARDYICVLIIIRYGLCFTADLA